MLTTAPGAAGDTEDDWPARLRRRTAETVRRRAALKAFREEKARRRAHGLIDRNAGRLARARARRSGAAPPGVK